MLLRIELTGSEEWSINVLGPHQIPEKLTDRLIINGYETVGLSAGRIKFSICLSNSLILLNL
jgi:hypothetical protein